MFPESLAPAAQYNIGKKIFLAFFGDFFIPRVRKEKGSWFVEGRQFFQEKCTKECLFLQNCTRGSGKGKVR